MSPRINWPLIKKSWINVVIMLWWCESSTTADLYINLSDFKVIIDFLKYDLTCHFSFPLKLFKKNSLYQIAVDVKLASHLSLQIHASIFIGIKWLYIKMCRSGQLGWGCKQPDLVEVSLLMVGVLQADDLKGPFHPKPCYGFCDLLKQLNNFRKRCITSSETIKKETFL